MMWYWVDPIGKFVTTILKVDGLEKDPSVNVSMGFLTDIGHARAAMHAGIAKSRFPLKLVAGKIFPGFPVHARPAILSI